MLYLSINHHQIWQNLCFLIFQIEVKSCAIFIHQSPLHLTEPSVDISQNLMSAVTSNTLPPTLVVCLPQIHITSSGMKSMSCIQEIPVNSMEGSLVGKVILHNEKDILRKFFLKSRVYVICQGRGNHTQKQEHKY